MGGGGGLFCFVLSFPLHEFLNGVGWCGDAGPIVQSLSLTRHACQLAAIIFRTRTVCFFSPWHCLRGLRSILLGATFGRKYVDSRCYCCCGNKNARDAWPMVIFRLLLDMQSVLLLPRQPTQEVVAAVAAEISLSERQPGRARIRRIAPFSLG